jgi:hypothetical protein
MINKKSAVKAGLEHLEETFKKGQPSAKTNKMRQQRAIVREIRETVERPEPFWTRWLPWWGVAS